MRILVLVPARGGSFRLPDKNKKLLGGKPLITWTLETIKGIPDICDVLVSTDDPDIASIARKTGVLVPWLRPSELATDTASSVDVALHALDWYEEQFGKVDGLLFLQPTSPFRTRETIEAGIDLFSQHDGRTVIGVSHANQHPMWALKVKDDYVEPYFDSHGFGLRSQDLSEVFHPNGCLYLITPDEIRSTRSFFSKKATPLIIDSDIEALDIDTHTDFEFATFIYNQRY
jgi:CMP-N,N'-diacetyllegionaminic acid synthase